MGNDGKPWWKSSWTKHQGFSNSFTTLLKWGPTLQHWQSMDVGRGWKFKTVDPQLADCGPIFPWSNFGTIPIESTLLFYLYNIQYTVYIYIIYISGKKCWLSVDDKTSIWCCHLIISSSKDRSMGPWGLPLAALPCIAPPGRFTIWPSLATIPTMPLAQSNLKGSSELCAKITKLQRLLEECTQRNSYRWVILSIKHDVLWFNMVLI